MWSLHAYINETHFFNGSIEAHPITCQDKMPIFYWMGMHHQMRTWERQVLPCGVGTSGTCPFLDRDRMCNHTWSVKQDVWVTAVWAPARDTLAVIIPASILPKHYFNQSKYYLRSHHFHQYISSKNSFFSWIQLLFQSLGIIFINITST